MKKVKIVLKRINEKKEIYEEIVEYNENIKNIYLTHCDLVEIPYGLEQLKNLTTLYLDHNQITKIQFLTIDMKPFNQNCTLNKLEFIDLYENKITKIENIHHLDKLESFYLFNSNQSENIKESKQISLDNYNLEQKQNEKNFKKICKQFAKSYLSSNDNKDFYL